MNFNDFKFNWITNNINLGIIICDIENRIKFFNETFSIITGFYTLPLEYDEWKVALFPEEMLSSIDKLFEAAKDGESAIEIEFPIIHKEKGERYVLISISFNPIQIEYLITLYDITKRKTYENFFELNYETFLKTTKDLDNAMKKINEHREQLKNAYYELESKNEQFYSELGLARIVQNTILPRSLPDNEFIKIAAKTKPYGEVNGDYYDVIQIDDDMYAIIITDATGHGMPAALVTTMAKIAFLNCIGKSRNPGIICERVNEQLYQFLSNTQGFFITASIAIIDLTKMEIYCANAGHHNPFHYQFNKLSTIEMDCEHNFFLGLMPSVTYNYKTFKINPGDKICFYTDGVIEIRNRTGEFYGKKRVMELITKYSTSPPDLIIDTIIGDLTLFSTGISDMTLLYMSGFCTDDLTLMIIDIIKPFKRSLGELRKQLHNLFVHGRYNLRKKNYDKAIKAFKLILKYDPRSYGAYSYLGDVNYMTKDYGVALNYYLKSLELKSDYVPCMYKIALLYYYFFKDEQKAEYYLQKILTITSEYKKTHQYLKLIKDKKTIN